MKISEPKNKKSRIRYEKLKEFSSRIKFTSNKLHVSKRCKIIRHGFQIISNLGTNELEVVFQEYYFKMLLKIYGELEKYEIIKILRDEVAEIVTVAEDGTTCSFVWIPFVPVNLTCFHRSKIKGKKEKNVFDFTCTIIHK